MGDELSKTVVLRRPTGESTRPCIWIVASDPGGVEACLPVLAEDPLAAGDTVVFTHSGQRARLGAELVDVTSNDGASAFIAHSSAPDLVIVCPAYESKVESYIVEQYPQVPVFIVEDYYASSFGYLTFLKELGVSPVGICVMDQMAHDLVTGAHPEVASAIHITGQPAFDRFWTEDTAAVRSRIRQEIGLGSQPLVTFMGSREPISFLDTFARCAAAPLSSVAFTFCVHPRDPHPYAARKDIFRSYGISPLEAGGFTSDEIGAASDLIIVRRSTTALHAIYRRIPTVHLYDGPLNGPIPPTDCGASPLVPANDCAASIEQLLKDTPLRRSILAAMDEHYPIDGNNTTRVTQLINHILI
jgi:hypothetical protein